MSQIHKPLYIDRNQLGSRWSKSISTLKRLETQGYLKPVYLGSRTVRYRLEDIERLEAEAVA